MLFLTDSQGFIRPVVFLVSALFILFFTYKKRTKWVWLTLAPLLALPMYQSHIETTLLHQSQERYATDYWYTQYQPDYLSMTFVEEDDAFNWWELETEGGGYLLRFNEGEARGFEVVDVLWEVEPLRGRRNALEIQHMLELDGWLEFSEEQYALHGEESWVMTLTDEHRILAVTDSNGESIYQLEDEGGNDE